jgi:hypothetical protein
MSSEAKRGCGYREIGGMYLCGDGLWANCDRLPLPVGKCPTCSEGIKFPRSPVEINPLKLFGEHMIPDGTDEHGVECTVKCPDHEWHCHVCEPLNEIAFIFGVGEKFYTPQSFSFEAATMGVSKRIGRIPHGFKIGQSWIYLVHKKAILTGTKKVPKLDKDGNMEHYTRPNKVRGIAAGDVKMKLVKEYDMAIFSAYKPSRIEMPVWESDMQDEDYMASLAKRGITPVPIADGDKNHKVSKYYKGGE